MRVAFFILLLSQLLWAIPYEKVPNPRQQDGGSVTDLVGILNPTQRQELNSRMAALEKTNGSEMAVVIIPDSSGLDPRTYAHRLLNYWGVGKRGVNNGLLYLVVISQRRMEVASGDGIRPFLGDAAVKDLLERQVVPHFKARHPGQGVVFFVSTVCDRLGGCRFSSQNPLSPLLRAVPDPRRLGSLIADPKKVLPAKAREQAQAGLEELVTRRDLQITAAILDSCGKLTSQQVAQEFQRAWSNSGRQGFLLLCRKPAKVRLQLSPEAVVDYSEARRKDFENQATAQLAQGHPANVFSLLCVLLKSPDPKPPAAIPPRPANSPAPPTESSGWNYGWWGLPVSLAGVGYLYSRYRKRKCPHCQGAMVRLSESEDDAYLDSGQRAEERLGSVDYDIWLCPDCEVTQKGRYAAWFSSYSSCPSCSYRALTKTSTTVTSASEHSEGQGRTDSNCRNCSYNDVSYYTIARVQASSSNSSSSDSSSSSSSYGGGSSNDGGAGASW